MRSDETDQSLSDLDGTILPGRICSEIKWAVEKRSSATVETERAEIGANPPGPPQAQLGSAKTGFQAAATQYVERLARSPATRFTVLLLDRRAAWKQN